MGTKAQQKMSSSLLGPGSYQPDPSITKVRSKRTVISPARSKELTADTINDIDSTRLGASFTTGQKRQIKGSYD